MYGLLRWDADLVVSCWQLGNVYLLDCQARGGECGWRVNGFGCLCAVGYAAVVVIGMPVSSRGRQEDASIDSSGTSSRRSWSIRTAWSLVNWSHFVRASRSSRVEGGPSSISVRSL